MGPAWLIAKPRASLRQISLQPFVAVAARNPKAPAQLELVRFSRKRQPHNLLTLVNHRSLPPRHRNPPRPTVPKLDKVSSMSPNKSLEVSSMSPVHTLRMGGIFP